VPVDDMREQMEVNVIGQVAVTQAFLDALRAGRGRIVNVGSISGLLATPITGPYVVLKFALEGMADILRWELLSQGIDVVMAEPGGVRTPLLSETSLGFEQIFRDGPPELAQWYGPMITTALARTRTALASRS
jgi:NAD(P)-dependent dehydrogenase (short-subunit alcohol dehydrogenase family)